jgi:hypothetical protein
MQDFQTETKLRLLTKNHLRERVDSSEVSILVETSISRNKLCLITE